MRAREAGFTLLESLVALAILSTVVLAVGQSLTQSAQAGSGIADRRAALAVASRVMETELSGLAGRAPRGQDGDTVWEVTRTGWRGDGVPGLVEVSITAHPADRPSASTTLTTLVSVR